jgi:hypothetical protein
MQPFGFRDLDVERPGYQSARLYELLHATFGDAELEPKRDLERSLPGVRDRRNRQPRLIVARIGLLPRRWHWKFVEPIVVAVVSGEYLSLAGVGRPDEGIGALGHLVTHPEWGRGGGHRRGVERGVRAARGGDGQAPSPAAAALAARVGAWRARLLGA